MEITVSVTIIKVPEIIQTSLKYPVVYILRNNVYNKIKPKFIIT